MWTELWGLDSLYCTIDVITNMGEIVGKVKEMIPYVIVAFQVLTYECTKIEWCQSKVGIS